MLLAPGSVDGRLLRVVGVGLYRLFEAVEFVDHNGTNGFPQFGVLTDGWCKRNADLVLAL